MTGSSDAVVLRAPKKRRTGGEELACDPATLAKWRAEVLRLRGVVSDHRNEAKNMIWFLKIGAGLAVPTVFYHLAMPFAVFGFALIGFLTGHYFVRGHLAEREENLASAEGELRRRRGLAGLPEEDETLQEPPVAPQESTEEKR
jgi:hypothetical protein